MTGLHEICPLATLSIYHNALWATKAKQSSYSIVLALRLADAIMWQLGTVHYFNQFVSFNFASTALRKNL